MAGRYPRLSKYRLLARLGSGGMAEVYLVLAEGPAGFNKLQVLKLMRSDLSEQERPDFLRMFQDEARLAARLNHPNIVQSHEVGEESGQPFIVMEYLDGQPLSRVQQRVRNSREQFPLEMELSVLCQVLEALEYAHNLADYDGAPLHIVHRDVSPQNVFITYAGQTKLVDFGVAKTLESSKTRAGVVKGKVAYMSPEQVRGAPVDHRADLFSVGVLLWEAIAGQPMYADLSVYESLNRLVRGELPRIRDLVPEIAPELENVLTRALATKPEDRYADADQFRADLLGYVDTQSKVRPRAIGEQVAKLFARERSDVNQVIRRALSAGGGAELGPEDFQLTRIVPDFGSSPGFVHDPTTPLRHTTPVPRTTVPPAQAAASTPSPPSTPRRSRLWLGALAGAVALTATASLVWTMRSSGSPVRGAEVGAVEIPVVSSPEDEPVSVYIEAEPRHALLVLDGVRLGQNPYEGKRPRDGREHTLEVSAPGHRALRSNVRFGADVRLQLQLAELATAEPPRGERRTIRSEGRTEPSVAPARTERVESARSTRRVRAAAPPDDPYEELAPPKPIKREAPELDRSDPWAPEQAR